MKKGIVYQLTHAILQGALTSTMIYLWGFLQTWSLEQAALSTGALVMFLGLFGIILNTMLYGRTSGFLKLVVISVISSLLVTFTFVLYPELGLAIDWYILLSVLILAAGFAHALLYGIGQGQEELGDEGYI